MIFQGSFFFEFARWTIGASRFGIMVPFSGNWSESPFSMACLFLSPARQILKLFRPTFEFGSLRLQYNFWHIQTHQEGRSESRDIICHLSERTWNHSLLGQTSYSSNILHESCTIMIFNIRYILYRHSRYKYHQNSDILEFNLPKWANLQLSRCFGSVNVPTACMPSNAYQFTWTTRRRCRLVK